jgi:hypothetical protein
MTLQEFLHEMLAQVRAQMIDSSPFEETVFSEIVMKHMSDVGMTFEPVSCYYKGKVGNGVLRLSGYSVSDDGDQVDLFVSLYDGSGEITSISDTDTKNAAEQCIRFLRLCAEGKAVDTLDPSHDASSLAETLHSIYKDLDQIRIFVLTDRVAKSRQFAAREIGGKLVHLEVMDIERLHRHLSEGKPRDELMADFNELAGSPLPCIFVPGSKEDYGYALTAMPGEVLRGLYEKFGARLLEANVRSFLSAKGKGVNAGIQGTLRNEPSRFMAYNNGIVVVADEVHLGRAADGSIGISWLKGLQIVNGGQTTASIFFTKRKHPEVDLARVRVPAKIIVMNQQDPADEEALISDISRFANSQNAVKQSDLSANKPFHIEVERLSMSVYCPDGVSRWFYERAAGSYNTMLTRLGTTPARLKALKDEMPVSRKVTKTDLAKYLMAWEQHPDLVSLGSQKNFDRFMDRVSEQSQNGWVPSVDDYKAMIAKAKLYRDVEKLIRSMFPAFKANVAAYLVALLSRELGDRLSLERVWLRQGISSELSQQLKVWAHEVNDRLHATANGRMVSEWAKKVECKEAVLVAAYSAPMAGIPEVE